MTPFEFEARIKVGNALMALYVLGVSAFCLWFVQLAPFIVAAPVCLGAAWFGGKKVAGIGRGLIHLDPKTGLPTGPKPGLPMDDEEPDDEGIACERCEIWCLASTALDEPCVCGCPNHRKPR